jgi:hypothetical protein
MNRVYLRNKPIRDELVFIGTNLFMKKSFWGIRTNEPEDFEKSVFLSQLP